MPRKSEDVLARVEREKDAYLAELLDYLRIPSVSTDPAHREDVLRCSRFVADRMREAGLTVESIDGGGNPLIYGEWTGARGKPTVLFYGHYDVQPPDPLDEWRHPPFEPSIEGDVLVARGATDDKGQSFTHLKAVAALLAERGRLPVNVKFLVEGEEEVGGESIDRFVRADAGSKLACDCVVVSDTSMYAPGQPSLLYGLKGLCYMELKVRGPKRDLHSGTYGGTVTNPGNALCEIVARLRDSRTGRILIPGFYDDVVPLADWEREEFARLPWSEAEYKAEVGVGELTGEEGYTTQERAWARPTCDVNGLFGGYQGEGAKTVLPARAGAKVSMRLVPEQKPKTIARLFSDYVRRIQPAGVEVEIRDLHGAEAVVIDTGGPFYDAAMDVMEEEWGKRPVLVREGGSIPIVATFARVLKAPVLLAGFGLSDDALHSPNEKFNLSQFYGGIRTIVRLLDRIGDAPGAGAQS
jgi:acetylornithine deacetylase/succinyl-diaminopimelate desuccinylase-like protein